MTNDQAMIANCLCISHSVVPSLAAWGRDAPKALHIHPGVAAINRSLWIKIPVTAFTLGHWSLVIGIWSFLPSAFCWLDWMVESSPCPL